MRSHPGQIAPFCQVPTSEVAGLLISTMPGTTRLVCEGGGVGGGGLGGCGSAEGVADGLGSDAGLSVLAHEMTPAAMLTNKTRIDFIVSVPLVGVIISLLRRVDYTLLTVGVLSMSRIGPIVST